MKSLHLQHLILSFVLLLGFSIHSSAQLSQTFDGLTLSNTSGGSYIGNMPAGWTQVNADGNTPNNSFSYMGTNGWITRRLSLDGITIDTVAFSISYYTPAGTSNDYLISPQFMVPSGTGNYLLWQGASADPTYSDGYEVLVSTTGTTLSDFTNVIYSTTGEGANAWVQHAIDLSTFAGQNIYVAFRNNSFDDYMLLIDDIQMKHITNVDAELISLDIDRYSATNSNVNITGVVKNNGVPINSLTITWNDGVAHTSTLSGLNIAPYSTYTFTHPIPLNHSSVAEYNLTVSISSVNSGATESNTVNNTLSSKVSTIANPAHKNVVIESGNGTWTGWSPRGYVAMSDLDNDPNYYADYIGIDVHGGSTDPMTNPTYDAAAGFSGFPGCNVDRKLLDQAVTTSLFQQYVNDFKVKPAPVQVSATTNFNTVNRQLIIQATADFRTVISDDIRFAVILVEDSVHGTDYVYNQPNYYSSASQNLPLIGAGHNWQSDPNPVPAADMYYNNIGRELIGGFNGQLGSIALPTSNGNSVNYSFTYTVPAAYNEHHLSLVVLVVNGTTAEIINASNVIVNIPTITASGTTNICPGSFVTLTAPASNIYQWQLNGVNISGANAATYQASAVGAYTVIYNSNGNLSMAGPINVLILPQPSINITASSTNAICQGTSLTLTADINSSSALYSWSNGVVNGQAFVPQASGAFTYSVIATDTNGCSAVGSYTVNVIPNPVVISQPTNVLSVVGDVVSFNVGLAFPASLYQWQVNAGTGWNNLSNFGNYSGVNTSTLTITGAQLSQNNTGYQCLVSNGNCNTTTSLAMLYVSTAVGLKDQSSNGLSIVPNPVKNSCMISSSSSLNQATVKVYDMSGRLIFTDNMKNMNTYELNTSAFESGIYFVEVQSAQQFFRNRIIKE
jgi:hypothetical protein